jgi:hypothetical protein
MGEQKPAPQKPDVKSPSVKEDPTRSAKSDNTPARLPSEARPGAKAGQPVNPPIVTKTEAVQPRRSFLPKLYPKKIQQRLADLHELSIAIDTFEDIFSDFDPRDYTKRDLSDDFMYELKRRYRETKTSQFDIIFHAPKKVHEEATEKIIIQRIKQHFRHIASQNRKDIGTLRARGMYYIWFGVILLSVFTFATYHKWLSDLNAQILGILFMPLGWFGIWEGFSKVIDIPWKLQEDLEFNLKMAKANYQFRFLE